MSLLLEAMENCIFIDKTTAPDGYGSTIIVWKEGAEFDAAIVFNTSMESRRASKEGVTSLYTVTVHRNQMLSYGDIFRRLSDGKLFRVTSDGDDKFTPISASLDMRQVTAEELKSLPTQ